MARCCACKETATKICGICEAPLCDSHAHPVNRWHNAYHARWICEHCYTAKQKRRKYVLLPILLIFIFLVAKSINVQWGLQQPSMWEFFFALGSLSFGTIGLAAAYHLVMRTGQGLLWLKRLLPLFAAWILLYFLAYRLF